MNYRFLLLLILVCNLSAFAQTELLNTNFQTGIPSNYTLLNLDAHPIGLPGAVSVGDDGLQRWRFA